MNQDNNGVSTEIETPTTGAAENVATESTDANGAAGQQSEQVTESAEAPVVAFAPNLTYRANNEEKQVADWLKTVMTDPEKEKYIKDLYSKADGLDGVKSRFDSYKEEAQKIRGENEEITNTVKVLRDHVQNRDFDKFFEELNIPAHLIQGWVLQKLQYKEMAPEQRAEHDARWSATRQASELSRQNQLLQSQVQQREDTLKNYQAEQRLQEFNLVLQDQNVNSVMQEFDQRSGKIGAFREAVAQYAFGKYQLSGQDLNAREAVEGVLMLMGKNHTWAGSNQSVGQTPSAPTAKPVIPNIQGNQSSPIKKMPTSVEDLRTLYEQKYSNQQPS